jgi:mRNA interferase YafQ
MPRYSVIETKKFRKSLKHLLHSGDFDRARLDEAINMLVCGKILPDRYDDHPLTGNWAGYRECHLAGDLLLVYEIDSNVIILTLINIGSHSYLFG